MDDEDDDDYESPNIQILPLAPLHPFRSKLSNTSLGTLGEEGNGIASDVGERLLDLVPNSWDVEEDEGNIIYIYNLLLFITRTKSLN